MTAERWQQIKEVIGGALQCVDPEERAQFVSQACNGDTKLRREVESLLATDAERLDHVAEELHVSRDPSWLGRRIGAYVLVREIGRGGMGAVYLAERADSEFEKQVAIKLLKRGTDTEEVLRRFRMEREILARLEHPNIARLFDGGTTDDGLPYFVMEYVTGVPITDYCSNEKLSIQERLRLFLKVCAAVRFAHQNLVVHRDLKPANILVTADCEPKLLDFGIAKLLEADEGSISLTMFDHQRLTPAYASPEQVRGEPVTTVSDVYALGVLLYEILSGQSAHLFSTANPPPTELFRIVVQNEPLRPSAAAKESSIKRGLRGDLDNIVLKALRKDPARRYGGVGEFAEDISRFLANKPVHARKDTLAYRASKFVRRHGIAVAAAAIVIVVLAGGVFATISEWAVAQSERAKAETRFDILRKSSRTMISEIHGALMKVSGSLEARKLLLQRAIEQLDALAAEAGNDQRLQLDLAEAYRNIGYLPDKTLGERTELFNKAIGLDQKVLAKQPNHIIAREGLAMSKINLADFARARGDNEQALKYNLEAIHLMEGVAADEPAEMKHKEMLWNASYNAALTMIQVGRAADALDITRRIYPVAVELREKNTADQSDNKFRRPYLSRALSANSLTYLGRYDEAISEIRAALQETALTRQKFPLGPFEKLDESVFDSRLALSLERSGQGEEAIKVMQTSAALGEALIQAESKNLPFLTTAASANSQLGWQFLRAKRIGESIDSFRHAVDLDEKVLAADPEQKQARADLAYSYGGLGYGLAQSGRIEEGLADERKAVSIFQNLGTEKVSNVLLLRDYAETLACSGETCLLVGTNESIREAKGLLQRSFDIWSMMRDRGILSRADSNKPNEIAGEIAKCDATLNR